MRVDLSIACADVGSVATGKFGWAILDPPAKLEVVDEHGSIEALAKAVVARFSKGRSVALGFECPLFVPVRSDPAKLLKARKGEGGRPWSAGAGCGSLVTGIAQTVWLVDRIRAGLRDEPEVFFEWSAFAAHSSPALLFWEALVSGKSKSDSHHGDAGLAVEAFAGALPDPTAANIVEEQRAFSLVAAALIRTGWPVPTTLLSAPCMVLAA